MTAAFLKSILGTARSPRIMAVFFLASTILPTNLQAVVDEDFIEISPKLVAATQKGLEHLASIQAEDGSYGGPRYRRHVGITALVCMAFMADGHLPQRGRYGEHIQRGLGFILAHSQESGLIAADTSHGPMYGHGFATLMLAEIYGQTPLPRVREALAKAIQLIIASQNHEGGWRYHPVPEQADLSVTVCQIMALRAARNAGIYVPQPTIGRAITYVRRCQNPADGGFRYMISSGGSAFPRSAGAIASLYYAGAYDDGNLAQGLAYLFAQRQPYTGRAGGHFFYGHYYAAQAMYLAGKQYWNDWFPWIRKQLLDRQERTGKWIGQSHGDAYATAMALLILQMPNRLLPIFQR